MCTLHWNFIDYLYFLLILCHILNFLTYVRLNFDGFYNALTFPHIRIIIFVIVDQLNKCAHFIGLRIHFTIVSLIDRLVTKICQLVVFALNIMSYQDPLFISKLWQELFKFQDTIIYVY